MILLVDNFDSFTYNLYQYFSESGEQVEVIRNNKFSIKTIESLSPEAIIISPGPGVPKEAGVCLDLVKHFYKRIPIFGVCLGHQVIAEALGADIIKAKQIKHGKTSKIDHDGSALFQSLAEQAEVMRYHSLAVDKQSLPEELKITAVALDDNEIMAIKHRDYPVYGIQFHPESIGTKTGKQMIKNFLKEIRKAGISHETIY